ncbi:MAG: phospho-N-acetylmuramoyl-pentapeptide-transferase [Gemmatimonadetes bacterium]|nr:phospho-N-acetylmuramoyl-pentapeptide-transferase [Gemmatimonadota bacterium]
MLYHLLPGLTDVHIVFNLFTYLTFRAAGAVVTSLVLAFVLGPSMIGWLRTLRFRQVVRGEGPKTHLEKAGTPTMGGVLILVSCAISTLLWAEITNWYTILPLLALLWMGLLGFADDYLKVVRRKTEGLVARYKLIGQFGFGLALGLFLVLRPVSPFPSTWTGVPFLSDYMLAFWAPAFVLFVAIVVAGTSNAVNLSDGLDGLACGLTAIAAATFAVMAYITGRIDTSSYLGLFYLPGAGEMAIFAVALAGAAVGFLWFNSHPAEVFMGDTGSLSMGGAVGVMAILLKAEFLLVIVGGVFVLEAVSVILQTGYFRYTARRYGQGRRIFKMSPLHHHFEQLGWPETKVVVRFWILGLLFAMVAISTLKIR